MHLTGAWVVGIGVLVGCTIALLILHRTPAGDAIHRHIPDRPSRRMFLAAISFFFTFGGLRLLTWSIHNNVGPFHDVEMAGRHIHHLVWGICLLLLVGYGWLAEIGTGQAGASVLMSRLMALLYGAAAALTLDEFALWLNLRDVYWAREGRSSLDAVILFGALLVIGWIGRPLRHAVWKAARR